MLIKVPQSLLPKLNLQPKQILSVQFCQKVSLENVPCKIPGLMLQEI